MSDRDPIRDLENFSLEGDPVHPLPASEVRRRGDRMRRRRTGALAVGAAAAVAVIATSTVVAATNLTGGDNGQPAPQPTPSVTRTATPGGEWLIRVPDDFPLADGWPEPALEAGGEATAPTRQKIEGPNREILLPVWLNVCGDEITPAADPIDRLSAKLPQSYGRERQVSVFPDDTVAQAYLDSVRDAYQGCPRYETDPGDASLSRVTDLDRGDDAFQVHGNFEHADEISENVEVVHVIRVGNAVLVERSSGFGPDVASIATNHLADLAPPLDAMSIFAGSGPAPETSPPATNSEFRTDIPKDFPIDVDLEDTDADSEIVGPSATARGVNEMDLCGLPPRAIGYVGRLAVTFTAPEYGDSRELVTFADADTAVRYLTDLRAAVSDCPDNGQGRKLTELEADTGYDDSVTFVLSDAQLGLGAETYQVVRVGNAVLITDEATHGTLDSARRDVATRTALADKLTPEMCIFTEAGC